MKFPCKAQLSGAARSGIQLSGRGRGRGPNTVMQGEAETDIKEKLARTEIVFKFIESKTILESR